MVAQPADAPRRCWPTPATGAPSTRSSRQLVPGQRGALRRHGAHAPLAAARRRSTSGTARSTCPTWSSPTPVASPPTPRRTRRSPPWRWRPGPPAGWPTISRRADRCATGRSARRGSSVSEIGVGCSRIGGLFSSGSSPAEELRMLQRAIDAGINFFDTSDLYSHGQSEILVGKAMKGRRSEVIVATQGRLRGAGAVAVARTDQAHAPTGRQAARAQATDRGLRWARRRGVPRTSRPTTSRRPSRPACAASVPTTSTSTSCTARRERSSRRATTSHVLERTEAAGQDPPLRHRRRQCRRRGRLRTATRHHVARRCRSASSTRRRRSSCCPWPPAAVSASSPGRASPPGCSSVISPEASCASRRPTGRPSSPSVRRRSARAAAAGAGAAVQPGHDSIAVTMVGMRTPAQLADNLQAAEAPPLTADELAALLEPAADPRATG